MTATAPADRALPEPRPPEAGGWIRRLWPFLMAHRRNVVIAFGMAVLGQAVSAFTPIIERAIVDDGIVARTAPVWPYLVVLLAAGVFSFWAAYVRRWVGGRVSLDVQYDLRVAIFERLQRLDFGTHDELQTGQLVLARIVRPRAAPGPARVPPDHRREPRDARAVGGGDALPLTAADARDAARDPGAAVRLGAHAQRDLPGDLGRPAARRRGGGRGRRGRDRRAGGEGLRPGGARARPPRGRGRRALRVAEPAGAPPGALLARPPGDPRVRPGRCARARRLAGAQRRDLARHLPGVLHLPRPARGAGPDVRRPVRDRPAGARGW